MTSLFDMHVRWRYKKAQQEAQLAQAQERAQEARWAQERAQKAQQEAQREQYWAQKAQQKAQEEAQRARWAQLDAQERAQQAQLAQRWAQWAQEAQQKAQEAQQQAQWAQEAQEAQQWMRQVQQEAQQRTAGTRKNIIITLLSYFLPERARIEWVGDLYEIRGQWHEQGCSLSLMNIRTVRVALLLLLAQLRCTVYDRVFARYWEKF